MIARVFQVSSKAVLGVVLAFSFLPVRDAQAQVFKVQGGSSTLMNADGGELEFKSPVYEGSVGAGFANGTFGFGATTRYKYHDYTLTGGDDLIPFSLPTDLFDDNHYFSARGFGVSRSNAQQGFYALAGTTTTWYGSGFFQSAQSNTPVGILFFQRVLRPDLRFVSRNIVSDRQTLLQGLEWKPKKWLKTSVSEGIGSNQPYSAAGVEAETDKLILRASYIAAGSMFRRITVPSPLGSEVDKGNVELLYKPTSFFNVTAGHQNVLQPLDVKSPMEQASVNEVVGEFRVARLYFGTGWFGSTVANHSAMGTNFYVGRSFGERLELNGNYLESHSDNGSIDKILAGTIRENFSQRFSLLQLVSHADGQTTAAFGGDFISNRIYARADYQNVYLPFRPSRPFQRALALNVGLRVVGPWQITGGSNVAPDGHLRYTFGVSTYLYRSRGMFLGSQGAGTFLIPRFLVQGVVRDEAGNPVEGAALHIGGEVAFTDSLGHFLVRFRKRGLFPLQVAPDEFLTAGSFEVVQAPPTAQADTEDRGKDIEIVVRRVLQKKLEARQSS